MKRVMYSGRDYEIVGPFLGLLRKLGVPWNKWVRESNQHMQMEIVEMLGQMEPVDHTTSMTISMEYVLDD